MKTLVQYTASGEPHGLVNVLTNAVPFDDFKHMQPATKAKLEKEKKEDARMVKVEVVSKRGTERLEKTYCRYAGDPILCYKLIPGRQYELPLGFVKEVNEKTIPKRAGLLEVDGKKVTADGSPLANDQEGDWLFKLVNVNF